MRVTFTLLLSVDFQKGSSFLVYKNSPVREDSEIDFPTGNVLCVCVCAWGGGHKNISQILPTIDSSRGEIARKTWSVMKCFTGNMRCKLLQDIYREYFVVFRAS